MECPKNDSSGTDDDLPNRGIIRASKGLACSGIMAITSGPVSQEKDLRDMEFQIHCIEMEAYGAVLRAFIAQSDVLSWGKEELISELRKELRVSDVEHREILGKINSDDSIKSIRESRKNTEARLTTMNPPSFGPNSVGYLPRKKLKHGHIVVSSSPKYPTYSQPLLTAIPSPTPSTLKARGSQIIQSSKKSFVHSTVENLNPRSDVIEIRATDKLIHEVERICGGENPDPAQVQRAKLILKDHERALIEAIGKLADVSDGDDSPNRTQHPYSSQEPHRRARIFQNPVYKV